MKLGTDKKDHIAVHNYNIVEGNLRFSLWN